MAKEKKNEMRERSKESKVRNKRNTDREIQTETDILVIVFSDHARVRVGARRPSARPR